MQLYEQYRPSKWSDLIGQKHIVAAVDRLRKRGLTPIRALCRAPKSREGDHFQAAVGLRSQLQDWAPEVPDWAHDMHTRKGKKAGRGLDHFRTDGARLSPPPVEKDPYEEECYEMWTVRDAGKAEAKEATLF